MIIEVPSTARAIYIFAHGAGAGMEHPFMSHISTLFMNENIGVVRFNFPYLERGNTAPGRPGESIQKIVSVHNDISTKFNLPLFGGGKSYGGRMSSTAFSEGNLQNLKGLIFFGFPLHPPGKPSIIRAEHLEKIDIPMLFLQGEKDKLAEIPLITDVVRKRKRNTLKLYEQADHSFKIPKKAVLSQKEIYIRLVKDAVEWIDNVL